MQRIKRKTVCLWSILALYGNCGRASPPLPDDLSVSLRVESSTDQAMGTGARVVVAFDVRQFGPVLNRAFVVSNVNRLVPSGDQQPVRISNLPGSDCSFLAYESYYPDPPGWYYSVVQSLPELGSVKTCRVVVDVLGPASGGYVLTFLVESLDFDVWYDPNPRDNTVYLVVGKPVSTAVPIDGAIVWTASILGLLAIGTARLLQRR